MRGMRDYVGEEADRLVWIQDTFRRTVRRAGYSEIITPILESFQLFAKKGGEELRKTMYTFTDKAGREVALRPEITPSAVRVFIDRLLPMPKPVRLFYVGPVYRYDEPQMGRYREFRQGGVELFGSSSILADVEVLTLLQEFFDEVGLRDKVTFKLGNVGILREIMNRNDVPEDVQESTLHLIDKELIDEAVKVLKPYLPEAILNTLSEVLVSDDQKARELLAKEELKYVIPHLTYLDELTRILMDIGLKLSVEVGFVRGLAYYTGPIFEAKVEGVSVSIAGGGRYDRLVELYGGPQTPAVGFAVGLERTLLAIPTSAAQSSPKIVLLFLDRSPDILKYGLKLVGLLRKAGLLITINLRDEILSKLLSHYGEQQYSHAIIIGRKEVETSKVTIRDLVQRTQTTIDASDVIEALRNV
ncbi:histidine--tRNA ligase [Sulfodiicoccus acidiphilus]|nr:histidine--tRNA ligase [Sulfodiicoccus acidiphilus]